MSEERLRWIKFWPQDWHGNKELRTCSPAARGVWMDLLCIAHDGTPYGHVTLNGKPATTRQVAAIAGIQERDAVKLLAELEDAGVFSRAENGAIYSRRMVKDMAARVAGKAHGKGGGNPILTKRDKPIPSQPITGGDNPTLNPPPTPQEAEAEAKTSDLRSDAPDTPGAPGGGLFGELPTDRAPSMRATLFGHGLPILRALTGKGEGQCRGMIGKWLAGMDDDCGRLYAILREAEALRPADPMAWLTAAAGRHGAGPRRAAGGGKLAALVAEYGGEE